MTYWKLPVHASVVLAAVALIALLVLEAKLAAVYFSGENGRVSYVPGEYSGGSQGYS